MRFSLSALVKLAIFAVMANTVAVLALPEPVGPEARQSQCSSVGTPCTLGSTETCCDNESCIGAKILGIPIGVSIRCCLLAGHQGQILVPGVYHTCY